MVLHGGPVIRPLTETEAESLLVRNRIGRLAYAFHDRVDIEPINYVYDAPWIFGRTSTGAKLLKLAHNRWCAFETDTETGLFDWRSVVVKGPFETLDPTPGKTEKYERAVKALRSLIPEAFSDRDPAPHRDVVFGIHVSEIEGRCSISQAVES